MFRTLVREANHGYGIEGRSREYRARWDTNERVDRIPYRIHHWNLARQELQQIQESGHADYPPVAQNFQIAG